MKKLLLVLCLGFALSGYSKTIVNSWACDEVIVTLYTNGTCDVGGICYTVTYETSNLMTLRIGEFELLSVNFSDNDNALLIKNCDNVSDMKHFIKCI
jgi:hypothetical protein